MPSPFSEEGSADDLDLLEVELAHRVRLVMLSHEPLSSHCSRTCPFPHIAHTQAPFLALLTSPFPPIAHAQAPFLTLLTHKPLSSHCPHTGSFPPIAHTQAPFPHKPLGTAPSRADLYCTPEKMTDLYRTPGMLPRGTAQAPSPHPQKHLSRIPINPFPAPPEAPFLLPQKPLSRTP